MSGREASAEGDLKSRVNRLTLEAIEKGDFQRAAALRRVLEEGQQAGCGAGCPCPGSAAAPNIRENINR
ncbi:MAG TPA: hypothetical protein VN455_00325 [Methanotrichaceae archaeon]|nr:hypothetical protein [Methanotrichaceae archaeon]